MKSIKNKLKLNIRFNQGKVVCAKSPELCKNCKEYCELMELFYYPFDGMMECFKNSEKKK